MDYDEDEGGWNGNYLLVEGTHKTGIKLHILLPDFTLCSHAVQVVLGDLKGERLDSLVYRRILVRVFSFLFFDFISDKWL